jgi:DNA-binding IscR family transcriptional regulator
MRTAARTAGCASRCTSASAAAQLGIAPETLSRVLRHLREHGLIAGTGNVLSLPQPRALQMVAGV